MPDGLQELIKSWQRTVQNYRSLTGNAPFLLSLSLKLLLLFPSLNELSFVEGRWIAIYQTFVNRCHLFMSVIKISHGFIYSCCSVEQLCPTLCNPMECTMPAFPVLHHLLEFAQTNVHWVSDVIQPSWPLLSLLLLHSIFLCIRVFSKKSALPSRWPKYWSFCFISVLPVNIQGWFPLRLTGLISMQSKGLSIVFFSTTLQKHQFHTWLLEKPSFDYMDFCQQNYVSAFEYAV